MNPGHCSPSESRRHCCEGHATVLQPHASQNFSVVTNEKQNTDSKEIHQSSLIIYVLNKNVQFISFYVVTTYNLSIHQKSEQTSGFPNSWEQTSGDHYREAPPGNEKTCPTVHGKLGKSLTRRGYVIDSKGICH